ncbi:conjugal transfer protein TraW [Rickettsia endosymbiont of Oedothorax gibbosus]|uniref:conjugal transfer protein TraW n=1 Tax=Rickettsia endosymbiont of Oedothorax gibbosus TaxID=931099 RepID=UPI002023EF49|nr:conjugal transfer protein TraW [Rickettsia endosymbiont of Oedothorax gibbosus]
MRQLITIALVILLPQITIAKDFGIYGTIFEVKEEGFLTMIQRKLRLVDIEQEQRKMLEIAKNRIEEPVFVTNIKRTEKPQNFTYEPSYIVKEDIILPNDKLLYALGTRLNPLDHMSLDKKLIFINGKDSLQIEWFRQQQSNGVIKGEDKLILIAGRPLDLQKELNREVYFDQAGILTTKFKIEQVPAIIEQEGKLLRIREVEID